MVTLEQINAGSETAEQKLPTTTTEFRFLWQNVGTKALRRCLELQKHICLKQNYDNCTKTLHWAKLKHDTFNHKVFSPPHTPFQACLYCVINSRPGPSGDWTMGHKINMWLGKSLSDVGSATVRYDHVTHAKQPTTVLRWWDYNKSINLTLLDYGVIAESTIVALRQFRRVLVITCIKWASMALLTQLFIVKMQWKKATKLHHCWEM